MLWPNNKNLARQKTLLQRRHSGPRSYDRKMLLKATCSLSRRASLLSMKRGTYWRSKYSLSMMLKKIYLTANSVIRTCLASWRVRRYPAACLTRMISISRRRWRIFARNQFPILTWCSEAWPHSSRLTWCIIRAASSSTYRCWSITMIACCTC